MCTTWLAGRVCRRAGSGFFPRLSRSWHSRCFVRFDAHALLDGRYMADNTASLLYPRDHKVPLRVAAASRAFWVQLLLQERPSPSYPPVCFLFLFSHLFRRCLTAPVISHSDNVIHPPTLPIGHLASSRLQ